MAILSTPDWGTIQQPDDDFITKNSLMWAQHTCCDMSYLAGELTTAAWLRIWSPGISPTVCAWRKRSRNAGSSVAQCRWKFPWYCPYTACTCAYIFKMALPEPLFLFSQACSNAATLTEQFLSQHTSPKFFQTWLLWCLHLHCMPASLSKHKAKVMPKTNITKMLELDSWIAPWESQFEQYLIAKRLQAPPDFAGWACCSHGSCIAFESVAAPDMVISATRHSQKLVAAADSHHPIFQISV